MKKSEVLSYIAIAISIVALAVTLMCGCCNCNKKHGKKIRGPRHGEREMVMRGEDMRHGGRDARRNERRDTRPDNHRKTDKPANHTQDAE